MLAISSEQIVLYRTNLAIKDEACNGKINLLQQIYYIREDYTSGLLKGEYFSCKTDTTMSEQRHFQRREHPLSLIKRFTHEIDLVSRKTGTKWHPRSWGNTDAYITLINATDTCETRIHGRNVNALNRPFPVD